MIKYSWCFLTVILSKATESHGAEHGLGQSVDDLLREHLGDDPFSKRLTPDSLKQVDDKLTTTLKDKVPQQEQTTKEVPLNGTQILYLKQKREADRIINMTVNRLDEFRNDVDVFDVLTKKFKSEEPIINGRRVSDSNNILLHTMLLDAEMAIRQALVPPPSEPQPKKSALRYDFPLEPQQTRHDKMRAKIMNMMYTHVYRAQYYVTFAQMQRKRYIHHVRYKLGFCFCLQRQLWQEQRALIQTLHTQHHNHTLYQGVYLPWALFAFEKVNRLQRDIRDVIHHIKQLEYDRKMIEDPDYYKFFPSSTGRYSG
ncbi:hypothetical protein NE865_07298 [Phthorimaea operculella]|nr:hypothetical protein NE865_07298 [Phthorimaea operculella]